MGRFVCAQTPGNADVLQVRDRPTPTPGAGEIVISQTKIGLNFLDIYQTSGLYPFPENDVFVILLTNRVHPTRNNQKIRKVRPRVADYV
ncbi:MAG: hypothetical protein ACPGRU_06330, partial [Candidatus Puniceispirillaceae bacterium]